jgi:NADPH:quinone reductase-like Zn-dependent oxidoreductase
LKAIVYHNYGSPAVLSLTEIEKPAPTENEVLIKVRAASINPLDWHFMRGTPYVVRLMTGFGKPKIPRLGADYAGVVEEIGKSVTKFKPGDHVFGSSHGSFAEYVCSSENTIAGMPENITFEKAAAVPVASLTALQGLRDKGHIKQGQDVLVNGASGGVGTFAVQIAKAFGAEVTGVCSTRNMEMVRSIGATHIFDYTQKDFTRGEQRFDIILDTVGNHSLSAIRRVLKPEGTHLGVGGPSGRWKMGLTQSIIGGLLSLFVSQNFTTFIANSKQEEDLIFIRDLIETGSVTPVIDREYRLDEVPEAIHYMEQGHTQGKVVVKVT